MAGSARRVCGVSSGTGAAKQETEGTQEDGPALERTHQPYLPLGVLDYHEQKLAGSSASLVYAFSTGSEAAHS